MRFDVITIFPRMFDSYINESIIKRARDKKLIDIRIHDLRAFTKDKHKKVDDRPFGGGPGMVLKAEPLMRALDFLLKKNKAKKIRIILFSAAGKQFDAKMARDAAQKYNRIIMIAGRYEGVDDRIFKALKSMRYKLESISIGPYVLTGGELPAMVCMDAISRHIPGVLGKQESLEETRYGVGVPAYTRPEVFEYKKKKYYVPKELISGSHALIEEWRKKHTI